MIKPYFIIVPQEVLDDLNLRIVNSRWPDCKLPLNRTT